MKNKERLDILIEKSLMEFDEELELFKKSDYPEKECIWKRIKRSIQAGAKTRGFGIWRIRGAASIDEMKSRKKVGYLTVMKRIDS